jgi:hypothetical protein
MAEIIGYLKDDATYGEKRVLEVLSQALPKDFVVYVECPLYHKGMERMPDFIVLTNYGVVVLEVKDWVEILRADKYHAEIRSRQGAVRRMKNPVGQVREFAHILASKLQDRPELKDRRHRLKVPWGYAAVLPNLPPAPISQLRGPWGENYVLGLGDLQSHVVTKRLKATLPFDCDLKREDLASIREIVNPSVTIDVELAGKRRHITASDVQERLVTEQPKVAAEPETAAPAEAQATQSALFEEVARPAAETEEAGVPAPPPEVQRVMHNVAIRLVRGVAGSGKTVVLIQRARYLAAQHPGWQIAVITYNTALTDVLQANLKGVPNVKVTNFDKICSRLLRQDRHWQSPCDSEGWVKRHRQRWPIVSGSEPEFDPEFVASEIKWIKEVGIQSRASYQEAERRGRGGQRRLRHQGRQRDAIYDILEAYDGWLRDQKAYDWADVPHLVVEGLDAGRIEPLQYDAVLIDEAQDFAPSWFGVTKRLLKPEGGLVFLADDPSQSIYRYFTWREKGMPVVGRTRWLRVPYRNTRQIYRAAYEVIREDDVLRRELEDRVGQRLEPDLSSEHLRSGPSPELRRFGSEQEEQGFVRSEIEWLLQQGFDAREIAVLHRRTQGVRKLARALRGTDVEPSTMHALKGLEFEAVFLTGMEETFREGLARSARAMSEERRLVYMAMTRARERLYLSYRGWWPEALTGVLGYVDEVGVA